MSVQRKDQRHNRISVLSYPMSRPPFFRNPNVCQVTPKLGLSIGWFSICDFNSMSGQEAKCVCRSTCFHASRTWCYFREYGPIIVFVFNVATFKHNSSLEFPIRIVLIKFRVLFNTNVKDSSNVNLVACPLSACGNSAPFFNPSFIPTLHVS